MGGGQGWWPPLGVHQGASECGSRKGVGLQALYHGLDSNKRQKQFLSQKMHLPSPFHHGRTGYRWPGSFKQRKQNSGAKSQNLNTVEPLDHEPSSPKALAEPSKAKNIAEQGGSSGSWQNQFSITCQFPNHNGGAP